MSRENRRAAVEFSRVGEATVGGSAPAERAGRARAVALGVPGAAVGGSPGRGPAGCALGVDRGTRAGPLGVVAMKNEFAETTELGNIGFYFYFCSFSLRGLFDPTI